MSNYYLFEILVFFLSLSLWECFVCSNFYGDLEHASFLELSSRDGRQEL